MSWSSMVASPAFYPRHLKCLTDLIECLALPTGDTASVKQGERLSIAHVKWEIIIGRIHLQPEAHWANGRAVPVLLQPCMLELLGMESSVQPP